MHASDCCWRIARSSVPEGWNELKKSDYGNSRRARRGRLPPGRRISSYSSPWLPALLLLTFPLGKEASDMREMRRLLHIRMVWSDSIPLAAQPHRTYYQHQLWKALVAASERAAGPRHDLNKRGPALLQVIDGLDDTTSVEMLRDEKNASLFSASKLKRTKPVNLANARRVRGRWAMLNANGTWPLAQPATVKRPGPSAWLVWQSRNLHSILGVPLADRTQTWWKPETGNLRNVSSQLHLPVQLQPSKECKCKRWDGMGWEGLGDRSPTTLLPICGICLLGNRIPPWETSRLYLRSTPSSSSSHVDVSLPHFNSCFTQDSQFPQQLCYPKTCDLLLAAALLRNRFQFSNFEFPTISNQLQAQEAALASAYFLGKRAITRSLSQNQGRSPIRSTAQITPSLYICIRSLRTLDSLLPSKMTWNRNKHRSYDSNRHVSRHTPQPQESRPIARSRKAKVEAEVEEEEEEEESEDQRKKNRSKGSLLVPVSFSSMASLPQQQPPLPSTPIRAEDYAHSPAHLAVALGDHARLSRLLASLPRLADSTQTLNEAESLRQEQVADRIASVLDRRDVPGRETPLHLAVRLNDIAAVRCLSSAGADISLQNAAGWNPLQEAICSRRSDVARALLRAHHRAAWLKWRRRLPRLVRALRHMRDFYIEISFHFESSLLPFVGRIAPSDTYRIWKRDSDLRADTSLAGFDGLKIHRADQSYLFLGDPNPLLNLQSGSLLILNRNERKILDAFENAGMPLSESDEEGVASQTSVYRPGMDVTKAELVPRTNWRRQDKTESVGEWKARVFDIHNVEFSFRTRKVSAEDSHDDGFGSGHHRQQVMPLVFQEDSDDGFLVAENPNFDFRNSSSQRRNSSFEKGDYLYNHNGKMREDREWAAVGRKSVDVSSMAARPSLVDRSGKSSDGKKLGKKAAVGVSKESEYVKSLRPTVWLTEQFPLKTEEILPLLDILANKVKAVRRLRELLTTKFPAGTFPVKVAIPVVPTVRVVVTFTKFVDLQPQFFTPMSSPRYLQDIPQESTSASSRMKYINPPSQSSDPFAIPIDYTWSSSLDDKSRKMKKSKSKKIANMRRSLHVWSLRCSSGGWAVCGWIP
ncbi:hypothetical protein ACLOJK_039419 [Asimina triloba]